MRKHLTMGLLALAVTGLTSARLQAQGLGGARPVARPGYGGYWDPFGYASQQQAVIAQRDAERQAEYERSEAARKAAIAERDTAMHAIAGTVTAAAMATARSTNLASQTETQRAFAAYKADAARRHAEFYQQVALPTDFSAESHLATTAGKPPAAADTQAVVDLRVPADAEVWFNGFRPNLTGTERQLTTPPLEKGQTYFYEVRARWTEEGRPVEQTRKVRVRAGERTLVDFRSPPP